MSLRTRRTFLASTGAAAAACGLLPNHVLGSYSAPEIIGQDRHAIVSSTRVASGKSVAATVHPLATSAAIAMLEAGGNAIDGAIAAALVLSVVDGHNSGIGGGCFLLIRDAKGEITALDGRETAPAKAHRDMFLKDGKPDTELSQTGPLSCGVPGEIAALEQAHAKFGKLPWKVLFQPAIQAAMDGYVVGRATASACLNEQKSLKRFAGSAAILLQEDGKPWGVGSTLRQTDLGKTLEKIATQGGAWFYQGEFAKMASLYLQGLGGIVSESDFAQYQAKVREPLQSTYRGHQVIGFPPPSSGGIHIAQMLTMLETFPLRTWYRSEPVRFYHVVAECMKIAFADRAHWLGDSDFAKVPKGLMDVDYAKSLAKRIQLNAVMKVDKHGTPPGADANWFSDRKHTTHLTVADEAGNWVAMTATVNTTWGSKVIVPGTGVVLNNQMDDFSIAPGTPNAFGLLGAEANSVEPFKRPLSSMSPTIVLDSEGRPLLTCGAAGGPRIINATLQIILRCLDLEESIDTAIAAPRMHHQWQPDQLFYEPGIPDSIRDKLSQLGHPMKESKSMAVAQGIQTNVKFEHTLVAAGDPRVDGRAMAISSS